MCGKRDPVWGEWEEESTEKINIDIWEGGKKCITDLLDFWAFLL